jgi:hypothetical protein
MDKIEKLEAEIKQVGLDNKLYEMKYKMKN